MAEGRNSISRSAGRLEYLDGLRGIAALIVVVFHFCSAYVPQLFGNQNVGPLWISDTPVALLYNGHFSVIIFFVLSGLVVSNSAAKRGSIASTLFYRYLRLAIPSAVSVVVAWALLLLFPIEADVLNILLPNEWLSFTYQGIIPSLLAAVYNGLFGVFFSGSSMFNNVLWTMKIELIGSWSIYLLYFLVQNFWLRAVLIGGTGILLSPLHLGIYEGFVAGAVLREVWAAGRLKPVVPYAFLAMGVVMGSLGEGFHERHHLPHVPRSLMLGEGTGLLYPLSAAFIVYACMTSSALKHLLSHRIPRFLGRISFSLYLYHVPFIYTVFTVWYLHVLSHGIISLATLLLVFLLFCSSYAYVATLWVDEPVVRMISFLKGAKSQRAVASANRAIDTAG